MTDTAEITDAVIVDEPPTAPEASTAVVRRERRSEVIRPLDADQLVASFNEYQDLLPKLLSSSDYQAAGKDKDGTPRRFVKKSGWRKIATAFDLDVQIIRSIVERDDDGQPTRAEVWARAIAPSGRSMDGDGYCSVDEERFGKPGDEDWKLAKARAKLENDLRATATTRAMNRAISGLVGMGEVSAEEVGPGDQGAALPAWAETASTELADVTRNAIAFLLDGNVEATDAVMTKLVTDTGGALAAGVARGVIFVASAIQAHKAAQA